MAKANLTMAADITVKARELDFVTRFTNNWTALQEILSIIRPIKKTPGTVLTSYEADLTLQSGLVGEGEEIPYSKASVRPVAYGDLVLEKYAKAVSIEAVNKYGAEVAVQKTDDAFLNELQANVMDRFYDICLKLIQEGRIGRSNDPKNGMSKGEMNGTDKKVPIRTWD